MAKAAGRRRIAELLVAALVLVACSSDGDSSSGEDGDRIATMLAALPNGVESQAIVLAVDYRRAAELFGIEWGDCDTLSVDQKERLFADLTVPSPDEARPEATTPNLFNQAFVGIEAGDYERSFGFGPCDVDGFASALNNEVAVVFDVSVDRGAVEDAVGSDPGFSEVVETASAGGFDYWVWPNEIDPSRRSAARPLGEGGALGYADGLAFYSSLDDAVGPALERFGSDRELSEPLAKVLEGVRTDTTYQVSVIRIPVFPTPGLVPASADDLDPAANRQGLAIYLAAALGSSYQDGQHVLTVALLHGIEQDAATNIERFTDIVEEGASQDGEPWSDRLVLESSKQDGRVAVFTLVGVGDFEPTPRFAASVLFRQDSLLWVSSEG